MSRLRLLTRRSIVLSCSLLACGALLASPGTAAKKAVWTGRSGGYTWRWDSSDVTAGKGSRQPFSLKRLLFDKEVISKDDVLTYYRTDVQPLTVAGSLLCYRRNDYWEGGAHPSGSITYAAVDVARPSRPVKLTDLFPDAQVRDALWGDPVVRKALRGKVTSRPATSAALVQALQGTSFGGEEGMKYAFSQELLSQFAFHHLEGDRVATRLCVSWNSEIYRFQSTELGLLLPIPERLRTALRLAESGKEGFLARGARARFKEASVRLFETQRK